MQLSKEARSVIESVKRMAMLLGQPLRCSGGMGVQGQLWVTVARGGGLSRSTI